MVMILLPSLVVKKPLAQKLLNFLSAPHGNRFSKIDESYLNAICTLVDYTRQFKGKTEDTSGMAKAYAHSWRISSEGSLSGL